MAIENERGLPKGWAQTDVENAFDVILGQSPPSSTYNIDGVGLPFFQGKTEFGDLYPTVQKWCSEPGKVAMKGDVLISVRAPVGPTNIAPDKCAIGRGLAAIRPLAGIPSLFVLYLLRSREEAIAGKGTGTTFQAITGDKLRQFEIPLPPLPEQHRIVAKIEELVTRLDAGVKALKATKAQLKRYRQSVLKSAFEGKFTAEWREAHKGKLEPASVLLERIKEERKKKLGSKYKESPPVDASELPELPEGWVWAMVAQMGKVETGSTPSKSRPEYYGTEFPFYKPTDLNAGYYVRGSEDGLSRRGMEEARLLPENSVLVTCIGATIGKTGFIRKAGASNQQINAIVPERGILANFLYFVCISPLFQKEILDNASATTLPILNKRRFEDLLVPIAPAAEQDQIVLEIERCFSVADAIEKSVEQSLAQSERLRQSILKRAFEGKLVLQDPNDPPASELLERIRSERESGVSRLTKKIEKRIKAGR
jgi:type I restriction enzyme S subunit